MEFYSSLTDTQVLLVCLAAVVVCLLLGVAGYWIDKKKKDN